jgi:hypothetical protein
VKGEWENEDSVALQLRAFAYEARCGCERGRDAVASESEMCVVAESGEAEKANET